MIYYNPTTGEYPRFLGDMQILGWDGEGPLPEGWVEVQALESIVFDEFQVVEEALPIQQEDGSWLQNVTIRDMTAKEKDDSKIASARRKVMEKLPLTDEEAELLTRRKRMWSYREQTYVSKPDSGIWEWDYTSETWVERDPSA